MAYETLQISMLSYEETIKIETDFRSFICSLFLRTIFTDFIDSVYEENCNLQRCLCSLAPT